MRGPVPSLYVQDTFHASKQLTVIAGLRWSPFYMPYDELNRGNATFNLSAFVAGTHSSVYPNAPAGMFFYGDAGVPRAFTKQSPNQWDPNLGFTYDLSGDGKTVLRGGAEYIYDFPNNFTTERNQNDPPFATAVSSGFNTYVPFNTPCTHRLHPRTRRNQSHQHHHQSLLSRRGVLRHSRSGLHTHRSPAMRGLSCRWPVHDAGRAVPSGCLCSVDG